MTRAEIRSAVITTLRESATPVRWTLAELNRYLDDGYRDMAERTAAVVRTVNVTMSPGQNYVALPSVTESSGTFTCIHPIAVKDLSTDYPLDPVNWTFVDELDATWIRVSAPRPYYYALWDWQTMLVYPHYGAAGTLVMTMACMPPGLAQDSDEPDFPEEYHDALTHYVVWRCLVKGAKGPRFGRATRQLGYYSERLKGLGDWTDERHEGIFRSISGTALRVPSDLWGN